ncbi:MAG: PQQ-binding-like beta-propeller repeat protein [Anaerolineales bacterium]|nr:PQQ-binding-like beta-propeller repeat protein [Anaerolineales bacterium]MDW8446465.1 PQQ-binding-like beta-propeller repeat protein [Anaerolineales bacterium]
MNDRTSDFPRVGLWVGIGVFLTILVFTGYTPARGTLAHALAAEPLAPGDWPQLGRDAQRTNYSPQQVNPPYCYTWKWYEVPFASRAQPVVVDGRLFIGGMNGVMYARNASTGAPLWSYAVNSPIRHSAGVMNDTVVFSTHAGFTYALDAATGTLRWKVYTGPSSTAPLMDAGRNWVYVASENGKLTALRLIDGAVQWQRDLGAPILTSPSLSVDGQTVFVGTEAIQAVALNAATGEVRWTSQLQGQSLADRYPVVTADTVFYRSQPVYHFHLLLHEGDDVLDRAGTPPHPDWATDWARVKPHIIRYLTDEPTKQTFFALSPANGNLRSVAPVLYTFGNNDNPAPPVVSGDGAIYLLYRARHGIQTDGGAVHVTTKYDAELGRMDRNTLDIVGLRQSNYPTYNVEFRATSDEPSLLTMGGDILWVDNWERLGGINVRTGQLIHVGTVSNYWPECFGALSETAVTCGPVGPNPFFPLSGNPRDRDYPFPKPRAGEGHQRGGLVIANNMLYWRVIEGGLAGISQRTGTSCPPPLVYTHTEVSGLEPYTPPPPPPPSTRQLSEYVTLDLTTPVQRPPADLVERLRAGVRDLVSANDHLMPFYLERGFTNSALWPYNAADNHPPPPSVTYRADGNIYWHDPGELLYTLAMAYPYLDPPLQAQVKAYMAAEMQRFPPLRNLDFGVGTNWVSRGVPRERYAVPFRAQLNAWPPPAPSFSVIYALWLWSKNTGDWSYARSHWNEIKALFNERRNRMLFYADIAGAIGYYRLADRLGDTEAKQAGLQAAISAMEDGRQNFATYHRRAESMYKDPFGIETGWYAPVFFGLTPEVGLYLREQLGSQARDYLLSKEIGDPTLENGLRWWYLTRAGAHAEVGETSFVAPNAAWSHFLAHAYILGDSQETLRTWLDRPWGRGDLYSIQKIVATIHAQPERPDFSASYKVASNPVPPSGEVFTYTIVIRNTGKLLAETITLTDAIPQGLSYVPGSLSATSGNVDDSSAPTLRWSGTLTDTRAVTVTYQVRADVPADQIRFLSNTATITVPGLDPIVRSATVVVNGEAIYMPLVMKNAR